MDLECWLGSNWDPINRNGPGPLWVWVEHDDPVEYDIELKSLCSAIKRLKSQLIQIPANPN